MQRGNGMTQAHKIVTVKLEPSTKEKLVNLGKAKTRSTHWLMKKAINDYVEREENKERLKQESLSRWKEAELGQVVEHDEVVKWLDSWGTEGKQDRT